MKKLIILLILISGCSTSENNLRNKILGKWFGYQLIVDETEIVIEECDNDQLIKLNKATYLYFLSSGIGVKYVYETNEDGKCEIIKQLPFKWTISSTDKEYPFILTENNWIGENYTHIDDNGVEVSNTYPNYNHSIKIENNGLSLNSFNKRVETYLKGKKLDPGKNNFKWIHPDSSYVDTHTTK
tara:strand:- start:551 stop:1102 length:552 start_codon:yes stop_codon:yes gene_type:complete